jgi:hypothetical protein
MMLDSRQIFQILSDQINPEKLACMDCSVYEGAPPNRSVDENSQYGVTGTDTLIVG